MFFEWLIKRNSQHFLEQEDGAIPPMQRNQPVPPTSAKDSYEANVKSRLERKGKLETMTVGKQELYRPDEIIIIKNVIPKQLIRNAQFDVKKWDADFNKLQQPSQGDMGFATSKEFFDKPVRMLVVTRSGLTRVKRANTGAYFNHYTKTIVMPDNAFIQLPTASSDGKLTPDGVETLVHELRHTTQQGVTPFERSQGLARFFPAGQQDPGVRGSLAWLQYLSDPKEMGVRLAAIKNYMSKESLFKIVDLYLFDEYKEYGKQLVAFLPENEKRIFHYILHPKKWGDDFISENKSNAEQSEILLKAVNIIIGGLMRKNSDIYTLLDFYHAIDNDKGNEENAKKTYKELMDAYDRVVKNKSQYNQPAYG